MTILKKTCKKIIILIITISILIMFFSAPAAYAKLDLKEGEFYYSGTTKGKYTVKEGIFSWLLNSLGEIADWLVGIMTMGFRMVFVGWTALIEKLLTWALETSTGVNLQGELVENSTDLSSLQDSSNNVTVEAIVYNKVPALNINFFDTSERDYTISGTGQPLVCEKCEKPVKECGPVAEVTVNPDGTKTVGEVTCDCGCNACKACTSYAQAVAMAGTSIIDELKNLIATWYYILLMLAVAAMLLTLIAVGVKMAVSSIAQEKAVYKRMLVDWVAGIIIIFTIHLGMYWIINVNEIAVRTVEQMAIKVNAEMMQNLDLMQLSDDNPDYSNSELEIKVYEEIRTRAYDPKLTIGLPGMIMYMTLVYFAIRYTIVYLKRYLTIMVLTLMGPPLGVAYALQKVFSGKSPAFKTWIAEYISNVFIQVIHAILYAVFVSYALILSLQSVAGMMVALVFMNFVLKADSLFRKIFKVNGAKGLADEVADSSPEQAWNTMKGIVTAHGVKEAAKLMAKAPHIALAKGAAKIGVAAVGTGVGAAASLATKRSINCKI